MAKLLIDMPQIDNPVFCPTVCMKTEYGRRIVCDIFGARLLELPETGINQSIYRCPACLAAEKRAKDADDDRKMEECVMRENWPKRKGKEPTP